MSCIIYFNAQKFGVTLFRYYPLIFYHGVCSLTIVIFFMYFYLIFSYVFLKNSYEYVLLFYLLSLGFIYIKPELN